MAEVVSEAEGPWILPEPWKTPGRPEIGRCVISAFPTTPWTGYARPQDPQARQKKETAEEYRRFAPTDDHDQRNL
jgi:hypothetical protein